MKSNILLSIWTWGHFHFCIFWSYNQGQFIEIKTYNSFCPPRPGLLVTFAHRSLPMKEKCFPGEVSEEFCQSQLLNYLDITALNQEESSANPPFLLPSLSQCFLKTSMSRESNSSLSLVLFLLIALFCLLADL
jgi:hypothetical protein